MTESFPLLNDRLLQLDQVIANDDLERRPSPEPDYKVENRALIRLAHVLSEEPKSILQELTDVAKEICNADSAGISIIEENGDQKVFRWQAVAGELSPFLNGTMPRDFSPCAVVVDRDQFQLMRKPIRHFSYMDSLKMPLYEVLLVPFHSKGVPIGTIWVTAQKPGPGFHRENLRMLQSLAQFAGAAVDARRRELALDEARVDAERANAAKSSFLANMSHEIRTPLGAILGFTDLLRDEGASREDHLAFIDTIERNGQNLAYLINDILDLSKVESGFLAVEQIAVALPAVLDEVVKSFAVKASENGVTISVDCAQSVPEFILSDPVRLRQILLNIVGNAVKFTKQGQVAITVRLIVPEGEARQVVFEVHDSGRGISSAERSRLFQPFSQADTSTSRNFGGTGLGLVLSRQLAKALGGDVTLDQSELGKGSTFKITVAAGVVEEQAKPKMSPSGTSVSQHCLEGTNVLVVDDSPDNCMLVKRFLTRHGATVELANNGAEAVTKVLDRCSDVVLMDMQMPIMDGYAATRELRRRGYRGPIIALSAYAMQEERDKSLAAGCTDYLTKPIDFRRLVGTVSQLHQGALP